MQKLYHLVAVLQISVSLALVVQDHIWINDTRHTASRVHGTQDNIYQVEKELHSTFQQMKAYVSLDEFDSRGFEASISKLSQQILKIEEQFETLVFPKDLFEHLMFVKYFFESMEIATNQLRTFNSSSLAAEIIFRKVCELRVRVLSLFTSKAEVDSRHSKNLTRVLSLVHTISHNLTLCKLIFEDLKSVPEQLREDFLKLVIELQKLLNSFFDQIVTQ